MAIACVPSPVIGIAPTQLGEKENGGTGHKVQHDAAQ
jgi:hypothetical protein